ncbi:MAG: transcription antitermination factor NusB [Parvularculaceae bacterium]|nr:transcription antitermination factor NusB [Parvularculaceae bacterium]
MQHRLTARLAAVQALYQMETSGAGVETAVADFRGHWIGADIDGDRYAEADGGLFEDIVRGVVRLQTKIDPAIERRLAAKWTLPRLDATARAILRSAAFELIQHPATPAAVVIDEYMEVANSFFEGAEPGFINAALDAVARDVRPEEFETSAAGTRRP